MTTATSEDWSTNGLEALQMRLCTFLPPFPLLIKVASFNPLSLSLQLELRKTRLH